MNPYARLVEIIRSADAKEIDEKRCFLVSRELFWEALTLLGQADLESRSDANLARKHQLDNFEFGMTTGDKNLYFICAKSEPLIDKIWSSKCGS